MSHLCDCCGAEKEVVLKSVEIKNGKRICIYLCNDCLPMIENSGEWTETRKGYVRSKSVSYNESEVNSINGVKKGWTGMVRGICIFLFVAIAIIGMLIGFALGSTLSYDDGAGVIGGFLGLFIGALVGGALLSFSMLFVEISENLASVLEILTKNSENHPD